MASDARRALLGALVRSTSSDPARLEAARTQLDEWESDTRFWGVLLSLSFDQQLELPVDELERAMTPAECDARRTAIRTAGMIRFKNGVDKFWRMRVVRRVGVAIPEEEKRALREALLQAVDEPERGVALQAAVAIARIARHDFPSDWPDLFDKLQAAMVDAYGALAQLGPEPHGETSERGAERQRQTTRLMRAVDIVQRTLKELDSVRIVAGKLRMSRLADSLLPTLQPMFAQYFSETFPEGALADSAQWAASPVRPLQVRTSHLFLKALRRLVVADAGTLSANPEGPRGEQASAVNLAQAFFRSTATQLDRIAGVRRAYLPHATPVLLASATKHLLAFGKVFLALLARDRSKAAFWDGWAEIVAWYWQQAREHALHAADPSATSADPAELAATPSKLVVQALLLLKGSLGVWKDQAPAPFNTHDFAHDTADVLIGKLMRLSAADLAEWEADAEDWSVGESQKQEQFELEIRTAAERTLMVLADAVQPKFTVGRRAWHLFEESAKLGRDLPDVLMRDAIYAAVGRLRDRLPVAAPGHVPDADEEPDEKVDLSSAIGGRLTREASAGADAGASWVIIRRRVAWLIWEWSEHVAAQHRAATYTVLVELLEDVPGVTDVAVRVAAARTLAALADALEFDSEQFEPFLAAALTRLARLAASPDLHEVDSIRASTDALAVLIERVGPRVAPHMQQLLSLVPPLWQSPDPDFKAKPGILSFVGKLVRAVELLGGGEGEVLLHQVVAQLVRSSLEKENAPYLLQDALALWARAAHSATAMTPALFDLLEAAPALAQQAEETPEACRIVEESALLAAEQVVSRHGPALFSSFAAILADVRSPVVLAPLATVDLVLQAAHVQGASSLCHRHLLDARLSPILVASLLEVKESALITAAFVSTVARVVVTLPAGSLHELLAAVAALLQTDAPAALSRLAPLLAHTFENVHSPRKRRSLAMALASLLASCGEPAASEPAAHAVCGALADMAAVWSDCLGEIREHRGEASAHYQKSLTSTEGLGQGALDVDEDDWLEDASPGTARLRALAEGDFIIGTDLPRFISDALAAAQSRFPAVVDAGLQSIDPLVLELLVRDLKELQL